MQTDVLILADGIVAKHLIERIIKYYNTQNRYFIVTPDPTLKPDEHPDNFFFYHFDPTSFMKLSQLFSRRFAEVLIVLGNRIDTQASYENVRKLDKNINIVVLDRWNLAIEDKNFIRLDGNDILANQMVDHLPNVPVVAQNVGLGHGEIMEVLVPFGSSYVYRHVGSIEQKNWKIAAIYRNNRLILPTSDLMIWPNDLLLLVGEPDVLKQVYRSIKREVGQFPMPFGINSYLFLDMDSVNDEEIRYLFLNGLYLHQKLNDKKLYVRIVNPNKFEMLDFIKNYDSNSIEVLIDYFGQDAKEVIERDVKIFKIGLFLVHNEAFFARDFRRFLAKFQLPIVSMSNESFKQIKEAGLILSKNAQFENISAAIFDIAIQLGLSLKIFQFVAESHERYRQIIEHFENLATIFSKNLKVEKLKSNPIKELQNRKNILLIYPLSQRVVNARRWNIFCTDLEALFFKLRMFHQIFLPLD